MVSQFLGILSCIDIFHSSLAIFTLLLKIINRSWAFGMSEKERRVADDPDGGSGILYLSRPFMSGVTNILFKYKTCLYK